MSETRRMLIEDYELMAHARRVYLGWLQGRAGGGATLTPEEEARRDVLAADTRLEGALLMDWELRPEFDAAIIVALKFIESRADVELRPGIPAIELDRYVEHRKQAIGRVVRRLLGEV